MPMSYSEPPIAPFGVCVTHDGSFIGDLALPQALGTREQCAEFIASHLPPKGGYEFDIRDVDSGRLVSFMIPPYSGRRVRLTLKDLV